MSTQSRSSRPSISSLAVVVLAVLHSLSVGSGALASAAEQEAARRHSLIHRPTVDITSPLPSTGRIVQNGQIVAPTPVPPETPPVHRKLTKRPALAPASPAGSGTSTVPSRSASASIAPAGQVISGGATGTDSSKMTAAAAKGTAAKPASAPAAGLAASSLAALASRSTAPIPFAGAAGTGGLASPGGGGIPISGGSRSALNLLRNSAIANLLQPPSATVVPSPATPPPAPPSAPPPSSPTPPTPPPTANTGSATISWTADTDPDLAGYKLYVGTSSRQYNYPGSPFAVGTANVYTAANLPKGFTYFFAISAFDSFGNESQLSTEVSKGIF